MGGVILSPLVLVCSLVFCATQAALGAHPYWLLFLFVAWMAVTFSFLWLGAVLSGVVRLVEFQAVQQELEGPSQ